ncbi:rod shape-determining protein MreD [Albirhodobacter sp. R86504]|jgi:rod shape-determining protein MreD|uniref:rod shape-determining protein MreD n=1 Tax=Albirhodobacter sp. R86504 TaxID=3093848 RepID=UPI0036721A00
MVDPVTRAKLWHRVLFVAIAAVVLLIRLLPISPASAGFAGPDITLALILAWVLRRPEYVPAALILLVVVTEDLLFQRPPGLWPLIVLATTESLRKREDGFRALPFAFEFGLVTLTLLAMLAVQRVVLFVTVVPQPPLGAELLHMLYTLAIYPVVVVASALFLGLKRPAPGQVDELGHRL